MRKIFVLTFCLSAALFSLLSWPGTGNAESFPADSLSRGEATDLAVKFFDLEKNNDLFLNECDRDLETCLFAFESRTNFEKIMFKPLILYPDVYPAYRFHKSINLATKLDLVRGYYQTEDSPFRPEQPITRVEALKLAMGASGMLDWKEKFEINLSQNNWFAFSFDGDRWWYSRYLATAVQNGILETITKEEADSTINKNEFLKILENANKIVAGGQTSSLVDNYGQLDNVTAESAQIKL